MIMTGRRMRERKRKRGKERERERERIITEAGLLPQLTAKPQHGVPQHTLSLWVTWAFLLPSDLRHGAYHTQLGSGGYTHTHTHTHRERDRERERERGRKENTQTLKHTQRTQKSKQHTY